MNQNDHETFAKMMLAVGELYGKDVSPMVISLYFKALADFNVGDVGKAFNLHVRNPDNGQFFPKPADLIRMLNGNTEAQGMKAWSAVRDAISRVGAWRSVCFDDPVIHLVIEDMGGWTKLCEMKESEEPFVAKDFEKRFRAYAQQGAPKQFPSRLLGIADRNNAGKYPMEPVAFIGDGNKARNVLALGQGDNPRTNIKMESLADVSKRYLGVAR